MHTFRLIVTNAITTEPRRRGRRRGQLRRWLLNLFG